MVPLLLYIYYQTREFQNESEDEIVYQMIKTFLIADGKFHLNVPVQQLADEIMLLPYGIYSQLLSLFAYAPTLSEGTDGSQIDEYNMVKKILLYNTSERTSIVTISADQYPLIGFNNSGVSCYFNSLVQSILSLPTLRPFIQKYQLIQNYSKYYPTELLRQVQVYNHIEQSGQESVSEYFLLLLKYWSKMESVRENELNSIFQYTHTYDRNCSNCGFSSSSDEQTTYMMIQNNFMELFDYRETLLDGYRCTRCFRPNTTVLTRYLFKAGNVIVVSLNRYFGERLIEYPQHFTFENLMMNRNDKYNLVATIEHNGSIDRGHYTARVKRDGKYYQTNDLEISILPEQQLPPLDTTYMLFYEIVPYEDNLEQRQEIEERIRIRDLRLQEIEEQQQEIEGQIRIGGQRLQEIEERLRGIREQAQELEENNERYVSEMEQRINAPREVGKVYANTLDRLRSVSYNNSVVNKMWWDKTLALKTSIGIFSEEAGQVTNFAESEDQPNREYLNADRNNMIFMFPYGNNKYKAFGYTLDQVLSTPNTNIIYECEKDGKGEYIRKKYNGVWGDGRIIPLDKKPKAYIKIPTESQVYVPAEELLGAFESGERVFLLYDPKNIELSVSHGVATGGFRVSDTHCQVGSDKTIYSLKVYSPELLERQERIEQERRVKIEQERIERERQVKIEQERIERERQVKIEQERIERERQVKIEQERIERERQVKIEQERIERERQVKIEQERIERERQVKIEQERIERERQVKIEQERKERERQVKIEQERKERERQVKIEQERKEQDSKDRERRIKIEQERRHAEIERVLEERKRQVNIERERGKREQEMAHLALHTKTKLEMKEQEKKEQEKKAKIEREKIERENRSKIGGGGDVGSTAQGLMGLMKIFGM